jgi:23S rRNA pseudouridine1911/1915/1917 synthase
VSDRDDGREGLSISVPAALDGVRVDRAVSLLTGRSRSEVAALVAEGRVLVDGAPERRRSAPLRAGSLLVVPPAPPVTIGVHPDPDVAFGVVLADEDVIVVDKPWDLVVHPGAARREGTLVAGILARFPEVGELGALGEPDRPGIVHRLDRGTSGLLLVARSPRAFASLSEQLRRREATRRYAGLVHGHLEHDRGLIDAPVSRSNRRPTRMRISAAGRDARTGYEVVARFDDPLRSSLVVAALETGRTHQVRVHMAAIGHPLVGDRAYGGGRGASGGLPAGRFFLHAYELGFDHPADGRRVSVRSPLPEDLRALVGEVPALG